MDYVGLLTSRKTAGLPALRASLVNEADERAAARPLRATPVPVAKPNLAAHSELSGGKTLASRAAGGGCLGIRIEFGE
ncbi:MAG TPA: hypothetical protein DCK99_09285 [Blastocatellia bacterium]|jgi:hypothetical protein|nr:hypothetical protein [Blastocatellia bacterium]